MVKPLNSDLALREPSFLYYSTFGFHEKYILYMIQGNRIYNEIDTILNKQLTPNIGITIWFS